MGNGITSQVDIAEQSAALFENSLSSLTKNETAQIDHSTTLQGNKKAQTYILDEERVVELFVSAMKKDIANINRVACEFEAIDQKIGEAFVSPKL
ncbi:hypothetical protein MFLO_12146 [Listeria floridensis FSL S10-1187]|uniref:TIGR04197 family type VII secretion effector n=1 Tax=Listeria floridensis FSL S10-1187 TaxID=1265817 RepID=A0ABP3AVT1_9LIST|nr:TIGR04197 family type VII secretion effector [Listeria floridensis]EUJ28495.1 hypothetical protein MFLO_12146 [Listeria floridensis FSL S10-1187]